MDVLFSIITKEVVELKEDRLEAKDLKVQVDICRAAVNKVPGGYRKQSAC